MGAYDVQWDGTYGLPLTYMHARTYSSTMGRFLQPDPSRLDAQLFVYAGNGPVTKVDPDGNYSSNLTEAERRYCKGINLAECAVAHSLGEWAVAETKRRFSSSDRRDGARGNAFQHCAWAGICALVMGSGKAKFITDLHENIYYGRYLGAPTTFDKYRQMDLANNSAGINIAGQIPASLYNSYQKARQSRQKSLISQRCADAAYKNRLKVVVR